VRKIIVISFAAILVPGKLDNKIIKIKVGKAKFNINLASQKKMALPWKRTGL